VFDHWGCHSLEIQGIKVVLEHVFIAGFEPT
jgi:hypothetical protein